MEEAPEMSGDAVGSFETLRSWRGSQPRAFEELSYQLLKDEVPAGSKAIRTGNPDGGVEWYATLADGTEHGWQAKHVHGIGALLTDMTKSVESVVRNRPTLTHLTFVVSTNLSAEKAARARKSQRDKYDDKVAAWKKSITGADKITFVLVQESDLLERLAKPEHRGRRWFWWDDPTFDPAWLQDRLEEQAAIAGPRYRPDLEVDLPIEDDLRSLGHDAAAWRVFDDHRQRVIRLARKADITPEGPPELQTLHTTLAAARDRLQETCEQVQLQAGLVESHSEPLLNALESFSTAVYAADDAERHHDEQLRLAEEAKDKTQPSGAWREPRGPVQARNYSTRDLLGAAIALRSWLESSAGQAFFGRLYFLVGPAGSGKTHLSLDATRRSLEAERPAVVLFGAALGDGNLWASICDQLGLPPVGRDTLLGAMDAAGQAASIRGSRFIIFIDALNETNPASFWRTRLPTLRAAVAKYPHIALAVSCRDTYLDVVDDGIERSHYIERTHPGFAGREVEATQKFFDHYGLPAPRIPLLVPEFSLPLFLRLYCESLQDAPDAAEPVGHEGRVKIFERYLESKIDRVARRFHPAAGSNYELEAAKSTVRQVIDALLDDMASRGREAVPLANAERLTTSITGAVANAGRLLGALQNEGIVTRELIYLGHNETEDSLRIVFQAFADYLLLRRRLQGVSDLRSNAALIEWLRDECSWGIAEAAAVTLPELYDVELIDLLGYTRDDLEHGDRDSDEAWRRYNRVRSAYGSFVETLPYRASEAVTDRTIDLLNEAMWVTSPRDIFNAIFQIAPQLGNRLNGEALHRYLKGHRMPLRDAFFGVAMYREIWEESAPTATLARWAANGPYPTYDPQVVELACIPLVWLLGSANRYMRDWVTKALVQLLRGHLDVAERLLDRFWVIDDPYIVQRIVVISYGALMASDPAERDDAKELTKLVRKLAFTRPMRPDELMLDAARGIVEWGLAHEVPPKAARKDIARPYGLPAPGAPWTEQRINEKYGYREGQIHEESYSSIWSSVMGMGDFGRYVVESGVHNFTRYRLGEIIPETEPVPPPRIIESKWKRFVASLTDEQRQALEELSSEQDHGALSRIRIIVYSGLTPEQLELFEAAWKQPKRRRWIDNFYPAERAKRWVFQRTLRLGWTPELFGRVDRDIGYRRSGREAHKAERWGKKYQWMAYHELLARVADNFQPSSYFDRDRNYEGLHQITAEREIDPTLPPIAYRDLVERQGEGSSSWGPPPVAISGWPPARLDFTPFQGDIKAFLEDRASEPSPGQLLRVTDQDSIKWIVLDLYSVQTAPGGTETWHGLRQAVALDSWFCPADQASRLLSLLPGLRRKDRFDLIDDRGHIDCCYAREIGWTPRSCYHKHADFQTHDVSGIEFRLAMTSESVSWEGSLLDCSIGETVAAGAPSRFIQERVDLRIDDRGPSWWHNGQVVLTNYGRDMDDRGHALLARASWVSAFLQDHRLELLAATWHHRMNLHERSWGEHDPEEQVWSAALLDADLRLKPTGTERERR
jgi:hypothetical protein